MALGGLAPFTDTSRSKESDPPELYTVRWNVISAFFVEDMDRVFFMRVAPVTEIPVPLYGFTPGSIGELDPEGSSSECTVGNEKCTGWGTYLGVTVTNAYLVCVSLPEGLPTVRDTEQLPGTR